MKGKWIKAVAVFCAAVLFTQSFSGFGTLAVEAAASDYAAQSNVFLDAGGYKTVPYGTVTSDYMNTYKERADVLPKLENVYLTDNYKSMVATVPTSDWASSVVFDQFSESLYVHPMAFRATSAGMEMANPEVVDITYYTDGEPAVESLLEDSSVELVMGGSGFSAVDARIDAATDWTYDISMKDSSGDSEILTTLAKGSPYVYYRFTNVTPTISLGAGATNMAIYINDTSSNAIGISVTETTTGTSKTHYYGVYASAGAAWTNAGGKLTANLPEGKDWITVAALPDGTQETFGLYAQYAANRVSNTVVEWDYSEPESLVTTNYNFTTTNMDTGATGGNTIIALYPHQWRYAQDESYTGLTYETIRGTMKTIVGTEYTTHMTYNGILAAMPSPVSEDGLGTLKNQISYWWDYYENTCNGTYTEVGDWQYGGYDTYWMGKNFNKRADILYMANQIEDDSEGWTTIKNDILTALQADLEYWFNPADCYTVDANPYITGFFFHYKDFGTLIGYNSSYSSDSELNDHHFHYGYWVKAAAAVAQYVPGWEEEWGAIVYEMISDFANPNRDGTSLNEQRTDNPIDTDTKYPFLRNFDIYEGHSWASGVANYEYDVNGNLIDAQGGLAGGNNQESTSEAINAWSSLILWGETVGDERIRDLGVYLYTTEVAAVEEYYFDVHDEVFTDAYEDADGFDQQVVTRLFGGRYDHTAWWTDDPIEVTSIHMIPMTGSTLYFSKYPQKITDTYDSIWGKQWTNYIEKHTANGWQTLTSKHTHHDLLAEFYAMADPQKAMTLWTIDDIDGQTVIETGESRAHTYGFIQSMIEFGTPDYETTGSTPLSMVFKDAEGNKTYVAQNFSDTDKDVYFSDGTYITVPANSSYAGDKTGEGTNPDLKAKVSYVLETYLQTTDKTGYECVRTEEKADVGEFTLVPEEIQGFTFDSENVNNVLTGTLVENENNQVTLKAYYNRNTYTIQYETGEGTNAEGNPTEYLYGTTPEIEAPTWTGYRFLGWYLDEAKTQKFIGITETTYGNLVLYADWISESAANYQTEVYMQNTARTGYECVETNTLTAEIDDEVSFTYSGDTTGFTLNEEKTEAEGIVLADNSLVLKVYYDRNSYHVSYGNMDGAENAYGNAASYVYGVGMDLIAPVKDGYTFLGWYTDADCTDGNEISAIGTDSTGDITVYAKWTETPEGSEDQGDTNLSGEEISVSYDADSKHVTITVNKSGLTTAICYINKYSTEADAKAAWEKAQNALPTFSIETFPGHLGIGLNKSSDSASKEITELTIEDGEYIVFAFNFGKGPDAFYYYKAGGSVTTSYTVNHYTESVSLGSYELADSKTVSNAAVGAEVTADANSYEGFTYNNEVSSASGVTTADGGLILNLYYDRNRYDIVYSGMGDASNPNPSSYAHGVGLVLEDPVRSGYTFAGWYTDEACTEGNEITEISASSTGTVTIYAKWEEGEEGKVNYTVHYYLQNETLNSYVELEEEKESFYVPEGTAVSAEIKEFTGFTHDPDVQGSVLSDTAAEGLQLKVYYTRNQYNITYMNMDDIENPNAAVYVYGVGFVLKSPVKDGYTFDGWYTDAAFTPKNKVTEITTEQTGDITLYANWVKGIYAAQYTVEYYLETENLDGYELKESDTMKTYGEVGQTVEAAVRKYHGFTFNSKASGNVLQGVVLEDNSLVLKVYYDRNTYNITYENMEGASFTGTAPDSYVYGTGAELPVAVKDGYRFKGWYTDRNFYDGSELTKISKTQIEDVTVYAKWAAADIPYLVKHYKQNAALNGYDEVVAETKTFLAEEGEEVSAHARDYTGFIYNEGISTSEGSVASDGSLVLEMYYDRETYTVTYHNMEDAVNHTDNTQWYAYDVVLTLKNPSKENYVFGGWYLDEECTEENKITQISAGKTGAVDIYAKWLDDTQAVSYKTEYYLQNLTRDGYDLVEEDTLEMHGIVGDTVLAPAREYTGFVKNTEAEGACESVVLTEGGNPILKVYYDRAAYGIVYHGVEGASNPNAEQYYYGIGLELEEPYMEDYRFDGWFASEDCTEGTEVDRINAEQTGEMELWAKWTSKSELTWTVEAVKDYDYTGKKITPAIIVKDKETGHKLQVKKDYTVKYSNNVNAGTATIQITGKGNYTGNRFVTFEILPVDINENKTTTIDSIYKFTNKGKAVKISPVLKVNGKKLKLNKDFAIDTTVEGSQSSYTDAGKYTLVLKGIGNYTGTVTTEVVLADKKTHVLISKAKITGLVKNIPYDQEKSVYTQELKLTYKGTELQENVHYELEYRNNTQAGTAQVIVKGLDKDENLKFTGSKTLTYKIQGQKITAKSISLDSSSYTYRGYKIEPVVTVTVNGVEVPEDQYTVEYSNNLNKGKGTVTVTGIEGYQGTAKKTFAITALPLSNDSVKISVESEVPYLKSGAVTLVSVTHNGEMLSENVDYTLKYSNNKRSGSAAVVITGKGNYSGRVEKDFSVEKKSLAETTLIASDISYNAKKNMKYYFAKPQLLDTDGSVLSAGKDYSKTFKYELLKEDGSYMELQPASDVSMINVGDEIRITVYGAGEYSESNSVSYRIIEASQSIKGARVTIKPQIYTGKAVTISKADITKVEIKVNGSYMPLDESDYEIVEGSYKNNIKKGTAKVTIMGVGEYGGTKEATFKIQSKSMDDTFFITRFLKWLLG